eukprot:5261516-Amphidinium_carterae.1
MKGKPLARLLTALDRASAPICPCSPFEVPAIFIAFSLSTERHNIASLIVDMEVALEHASESRSLYSIPPCNVKQGNTLAPT